MEPKPNAEQVRTMLRAPLPDTLDATVERIRSATEPADLRESTLFLPIFSALIFLIALAAMYAVSGLGKAWPAVVAGLIGAAFCVLALVRLRGQVLRSIFAVRKWAAGIMQGDLGARVEVPARGDCVELMREINTLAESLGFLCINMDQQARRQMEQLEQKTRSLEILYDAAAGIDLLHDLDDLLLRFLPTLVETAHARAGVARRMVDDDRMRLVGASGVSDEAQKQARLIQAADCLVGSHVTEELLFQRDLTPCRDRIALEFAGDPALGMLTIPIRHAGRTFGVYNLFVAEAAIVERQDVMQLFGNIARHLGIAIEKARLERDARRLSIMEERTLLANELHDSLAQTLASLRFQINMAEESVSQSRDRAGIRQIRTIKEGLDQANAQLRELLVHFRTRMDERGLIPAIDAMVQRFQKESGIAVFFQNEATQVNLPPAIEVQVLHIVQEALTNVRKHSGAQNVRILLSGGDEGRFEVLVEDDGQGIQNRVLDDAPGEHIGLSIMRERAARLGGELTIESEPGEGTRVELQFRTTGQRRARARDDAGPPGSLDHE
jgi:two-component system nitrate/nitrite sensor histidine kinase NarX